MFQLNKIAKKYQLFSKSVRYTACMFIISCCLITLTCIYTRVDSLLILNTAEPCLFWILRKFDLIYALLPISKTYIAIYFFLIDNSIIGTKSKIANYNLQLKYFYIFTETSLSKHNGLGVTPFCLNSTAALAAPIARTVVLNRPTAISALRTQDRFYKPHGTRNATYILRKSCVT